MLTEKEIAEWNDAPSDAVHADVNSMVKEFQTKMETPETHTFWIKLINEETAEVLEAAAHLVKECTDLTYVCMGYQNIGGKVEPLVTVPEINAALQWIDVIKDAIAERTVEAFKRVHESNMSKLGDDGKPIRRATDGKILKGPNYKPPVLDDLVR